MSICHIGKIYELKHQIDNSKGKNEVERIEGFRKGGLWRILKGFDKLSKFNLYCYNSPCFWIVSMLL